MQAKRMGCRCLEQAPWATTSQLILQHDPIPSSFWARPPQFQPQQSVGKIDNQAKKDAHTRKLDGDCHRDVQATVVRRRVIFKALPFHHVALRSGHAVCDTEISGNRAAGEAMRDQQQAG